MTKALMMSALLVGATVFSACGGASSPARDLKNNVQMYHNLMRWGRYSEAAMYIPPAQQEEFLGRYDELGDDFKIVEMKLKSVRVVAEDKATVEMVVEWVRAPSMTVHKDVVTESWVQVKGRWVVQERSVESQ